MADDPWAAYPILPQQAAPAAGADPWAGYPLASEAGGTRIMDPATGDIRPAPDKVGVPSASEPFFMGLRDPIDKAAQMLSRGVEAVAPGWMKDWATGQRQSTDEAVQQAQQDYAANQGQRSFDPGRMAGNVVATAPLAYAMPGAGAAGLGARALSGAASGAASGALQPVDPAGGDFWKQTGSGALGGAAVGAAAPALFGGVARIVSPKSSDNVQTLLNAGVTPTPGQVLGNSGQSWLGDFLGRSANRLEEGGQSIPIVGDVVGAARGRTIGDFNRGAINQVLKPIGETLDEKTPLGREAISEAATKVGDAYDRLIPQLTVKVDPQFHQDMAQISSMAQFLPKASEDQFRKVLGGQVLSKFSPNGTMTGESFKEVESTLGRLASDYSNSAIAEERQLGGAFRQTQANLRDLLERSNPDRAAELQGVNTAYANLLRVQGAAAAVGSKEGVFTPAQLLRSVASLDPSLRKSSFARGGALMQDYAEAGKTVLGDKVPDSGTAFRTMAGLGALGGLHAYSPALAATAGGLGAGAMAAYSPWGHQLISRGLASRPEGAAALAKGIRQITPLGSAAGPAFSSYLGFP